MDPVWNKSSKKDQKIKSMTMYKEFILLFQKKYNKIHMQIIERGSQA